MLGSPLFAFTALLCRGCIQVSKFWSEAAHSHLQLHDRLTSFTVIVTDEPRGNLRVCGFGSGGRCVPDAIVSQSPALRLAH